MEVVYKGKRFRIEKENPDNNCEDRLFYALRDGDASIRDWRVVGGTTEYREDMPDYLKSRGITITPTRKFKVGDVVKFNSACEYNFKNIHTAMGVIAGLVEEGVYAVQVLFDENFADNTLYEFKSICLELVEISPGYKLVAVNITL